LPSYVDFAHAFSSQRSVSSSTIRNKILSSKKPLPDSGGEISMKRKSVFIVVCLFISACGINSVTKEQLDRVKAGDVLVYRFQKNGKSWFYADKITRIDGDTVYYNPGKMEATAGNDDRLKDFVTDKEGSIARTDLLKYTTEQGDDKKVIIWIR
jgi:hypothetical protein